MKTLYKVIKWLIFIFLLGLTIKLMKINRDLKRESDTLTRILHNKKPNIPDTVYILEPFQKESAYKETVHPERIYLYSDSVMYSHSGNQPTSHMTRSTGDSLIQFILDPNVLKLSYLNKDSQNYFTREYNLDLNDYSYYWTGNTLSKKEIKPIKKIKSFLSGSIRPINNLWDFNTGLYFETKSLNYKLGFNSFYYPKFQKSLGFDVEFTVTYNF